MRLPLFSLRIHRRILGCGYHSDNKGVLIFFPSFSLEVDDEVDNYVTCHSLGRSNKDFDYIQPRASLKSAAAGLAPGRSSRLNPPPSKDSLTWISVRPNPDEAGPPQGSAFDPLPGDPGGVGPPAPRGSTRLNHAPPKRWSLSRRLICIPPVQRRRRRCSTQLGPSP